MHLASPPLAFFGLEPWMIAIVVPVVAMIFAGVMAVSAMYFKNRERELLHETARLALEKGQPLPAELLQGLAPSEPRPVTSPARNDIRAGLVLIAVGVGLYLFFAHMSVDRMRFVGAIPGLIGVALLLYGGLMALFSPKRPSGDAPAPRL